MRARTLVPLALLPAFLAAAAPDPRSGVGFVLGPGGLVGRVHPVVVAAGQDVAAIAAAHGVHPVRVTKPSARRLKDGLTAGETVFVDTRRIRPAFPPAAHGIVINLPEAHLYLVDGGQPVADWPVGVSQPDSDWRAPVGSSQVVALVEHPPWHIPAKIQRERAAQGLPAREVVPPGPDNPLGPRWIGFGDGTYGIHGTRAPSTIKRYASHGCVRMRNADVVALFARVEKGTPVHVAYQPVLLATDARTVWLEAFPDVYARGYDYRAATRTLAERAGVADRLDAAAVERALTAKDGIPRDVGQPQAPASPLVVPPSPKQAPSAAPPASPSAAP